MRNTQRKLIIFNPSIEDGGVEKNLYIVTNFLALKLRRIELICASPEKKNKFNKKVNFTYPKNIFWHNKSRLYKYTICLYMLLKEILINKNILVLSFQANIYCIILCKLFKVKIIVRSNTSPKGWSNNLIKKIIFKYYLKKADHVISNSKIFKVQLNRMFGAKSSTIYNPLNTKYITRLSKEKVKLPFFQSKNKILKAITVGRLTDQKDHETIINAINQIKYDIPIRLIIIGKGKNHKKLMLQIKNKKLEKNIKLIGYKKNPYKFIKASDLFILSSKFEGLPNVLLEAMYLKKFIISTNCPTGPSEILNKGNYGYLFKVSDSKQLSKLIVKFFYNKNKEKEKIRKGFNSLNRFDFNKNCSKYYQIVKKYI